VQGDLAVRECYANEDTLADLTVEWLRTLRDSKGRAPLGRLTSPVLVVMDLQRLFLDERSPAYLPTWPAVRIGVERLLKRFRELGHPIIWTRHVDSGGRSGTVVAHFGGRPITEGDPLSEFTPNVRPAHGEAECVKSRYSAWSSPGFDALLPPDARLVLAGVTTHRCVVATAVDASSRDRICVVAADATATLNARLHMAALSVLSGGFAHVAAVDEILAAIRSGSAL